jgi:DNA-binding MarR family transcriptional regulator
LTFAQWLVLESTYGLIVETGDATNQAAVAVRMELDKMTVSQVMTTLDERGLVDRGPDLTGRAYRIWVTSSGQRALSKGRERVEAASLAALGPHHGRLGKALQVRAAELQ